MGQCYIIINLTKGEYIKPYGGVKLMEHSWCFNNTTTHVTNLLMNEWFGDRVIWCGDYVEKEAFKQYKHKPEMTEYGVETLYHYAQRKFEQVNKPVHKYNDFSCEATKMRLKDKPEFFLNLTKRQYMRFSKIPKEVNYYRQIEDSDTWHYTKELEDKSEVEIKEILKTDKKIKAYETQIYTPALLLATSNGEGGGDYYGINKEMCGRWVGTNGDRVGICSTVEECVERDRYFTEYAEIIPEFKEE